MDIWKIGVNIALTNSVSPVLAVIAKDLLGIKGPIREVEAAFGSWKVAILGAATAIGGAGLLGAVGKLVADGRELVHQQELLKTAGLDNQKIAEATAKAYQTSVAIPNSTAAENLKSIRELRMAFGDTPDAMKYLDDMRRAQTVVDAVKGGYSDQIFEFVKSLEMKGVTQNPAEFEHYLDTMTKVVTASGGRVTPSQFFSTFKYGRTATYGWDEDFIGKYLPTLIQEMAGGGGNATGGPGNALMSAYQAVVSGVMTKQAAEEFLRLGLLNDKSFKPIEGSALGKVSPYGVTNTSEFMQNPYKWVQDVLVPALKSHGITSQQDILNEVSQLFHNRTASQVMSLMALQGSAMMGDKGRFEKDANNVITPAMGINAADELLKNDPTTVMREFTAQWKNLMQALGAPGVPIATTAIKAIADGLSKMAQFAGAHPEGVKLALEGVAGLGAAMVVLGGAAVLAAAVALVPGGAVAAAVTGIGFIMASLVAFNWQGVKTVLTGVADAISSGVQYLVDKVKAAWNAVAGFFGSIGAGISSGVHDFRHWMGKGIGLHPGANGSWGSGSGSSGSWGPQGMNVVPPPSSGGSSGSSGNVYMDGRKVGQIVSKHMAVAANGPLVGSAYYDTTRGMVPVDYSGG